MFFIILASKIKKKENEEEKLLELLLLYSLSIIIVMYPISDEIHFLIGSIITIISLMYLAYLIFSNIYNKINNCKKYKRYKLISFLIWLILFSIILINIINNIYLYINVEKNTEIKHYYGIEINENLRSRIQMIDSYIINKQSEGKKVYILDPEAAVYNIPLDSYYKNYDMFLKGNIGKDGENGIISDIEEIEKNEENSLVLIRKQNIHSNWQTPTEVVAYVRSNFDKVEDVGIFEVYK